MDVSSLLMASLTSVLVGVVLLIIEYYLLPKFKRKKDAKTQETQDAITNAQINLVKDLLADIPETAKDKYVKYLLMSQRADGSFPEPPITISSVNLPEIDKQVEKTLAPLKKRIKEIEKRFPEASTIDKIASVNDAILATKIEWLIEENKELKKSVLTKWNVAAIVIEVMTILGTLVTLILAALQYYAGK